MVRGRLLEDMSVEVTGSDAAKLYGWGFGRLVSPKRLVLEPHEALYLVEEGQLEVEREGGPIGLQELLNLYTTSLEGFWVRYLVFRDLKRRRYTVAKGLDDALFLRVYERGRIDTARYLVMPLFEGEPVTVGELLRRSKQSMDQGKQLLLAIVERRGEVIYYLCTESSPTSPRREGRR
jgi:tRNA-intron endonuclease